MSCSCEQLDLDSTSEPETEVAPTMAWHGQAPIANAIPIPDNTNAEHMHKYITNWCVIGVRTPLSSLVSSHSSQVILLLSLLVLLWLTNMLPSSLTPKTSTPAPPLSDVQYSPLIHPALIRHEITRRKIELLTSNITRVCTARPLHSPLRGPTLTNGPTPSSSTSAVVMLSSNPSPPPPPNRPTRFHLSRPPHMSGVRRRTCSAPSPPRSRSSAPPSARSSASIWTVSCAMSSLPHLIDRMRTCAAW